MTVFVLTNEFDYEGERHVGVFHSLESAKARATELAGFYGWDGGVCWHEESALVWRTTYGSSHYIVRQEVVQ